MEKYSMDDDSKSKVIKIGKYSNGKLLLGKQLNLLGL
jgi:hypothetical protein